MKKMEKYLKAAFGDKYLQLEKLNGDTNGLIETYDLEGFEYCVFIKNNDNGLKDLIKYQLDNIERKFILVYRDFREFYNDKIVNVSALAKELKISKKELNDAEDFLKVNSITYFYEDSSMSFEVDSERFNYLTYNSDVARADIFSINIGNILDLFNVQGNNLFKRNIREGLVRKGTDSNQLQGELKTQFAREFAKFIYENKEFDESLIESVIEKLNLGYDFNEEYDRSDKPVDFWFKHNGITIVADNCDSVIREYSTLIIKPAEVQVVNGAQTISRLFEIREAINQIDELAEKAVSTFLRKMYVKVTIIKPIKESFNKMDSNFVNEVTVGLNTQTPILGSDIFVKQSPQVASLKEILEGEGIQIANIGKIINKINYFSLKDIIQLYYCAKGNPGKSRNLPVKSISDDKLITEIIRYLGSDGDGKDILAEFSTYLSKQVIIEREWKKNKKTEIIVDETEYSKKIKSLLANGLSYFKSYLFNYLDFNFDEDYSDELFCEDLKKYFYLFKTDFIKFCIESNKFENIDSNLFKKDNCYEYIIKCKKEISLKKIGHGTSNKQDVFNEISKINELIKVYIDNGEINVTQKNWKNNAAKRVLSDLGADLNDVRTITIENGKVTEAFPFDTSSFLSLANQVLETNDIKNIEFNNSQFEILVKKEYNLFIFDNNNLMKIVKINFDKYMKQAEEVYKNTAEALYNSDGKYVFVAASDKKAFHIRPKARNKKDKLILVDGSELVKQTFWANKDTMNEIIAPLLK